MYITPSYFIRSPERPAENISAFAPSPAVKVSNGVQKTQALSYQSPFASPMFGKLMERDLSTWDLQDLSGEVCDTLKKAAGRLPRHDRFGLRHWRSGVREEKAGNDSKYYIQLNTRVNSAQKASNPFVPERKTGINTEFTYEGVQLDFDGSTSVPSRRESEKLCHWLAETLAPVKEKIEAEVGSDRVDDVRWCLVRITAEPLNTKCCFVRPHDRSDTPCGSMDQETLTVGKPGICPIGNKDHHFDDKGARNIFAFFA